MPAKRRNEPRYKSFLGRVFILRKCQTIPGRLERSGPKKGMPLDGFGQAVLILDESNSLVKVCKIDSSYAWIPKYYLLKEIKDIDSAFRGIDEINNIIQSLLTSIESLQEKAACSKSKQKVSISNHLEEIKKITNSLRQYADKVNPVVPKA